MKRTGGENGVGTAFLFEEFRQDPRVRTIYRTLTAIQAAAGLYNYVHNIITVIPLYSGTPGGPENFGSTVAQYFTVTLPLQYVIIIIIGAGLDQSV